MWWTGVLEKRNSAADRAARAADRLENEPPRELLLSAARLYAQQITHKTYSVERGPPRDAQPLWPS